MPHRLLSPEEWSSPREVERRARAAALIELHHRHKYGDRSQSPLTAEEKLAAVPVPEAIAQETAKPKAPPLFDRGGKTVMQFRAASSINLRPSL